MDDTRGMLEDPRPLIGVVGCLSHEGQAPYEDLLRALSGADGDAGVDLRYAEFSQGHVFPTRKAVPASWRTVDGLRVVEGYRCDGIIKRNWLRKHLALQPAVVLLFADLDLSLPPAGWAAREGAVVSEMHRLATTLAASDIGLIVVLHRRGVGPGAGTSQMAERDAADERIFGIRRRCELDARYVHMLSAADLAPALPVARRLVRQLRETALAFYAASAARLRRWEKLLAPSRPLHRPLLVRILFKLGVMSELQGSPDRTVACFQESLVLLSEILAAATTPAASAAVGNSRGVHARSDGVVAGGSGGSGVGSLTSATSMGSIDSVVAAETPPDGDPLLSLPRPGSVPGAPATWQQPPSGQPLQQGVLAPSQQPTVPSAPSSRDGEEKREADGPAASAAASVTAAAPPGNSGSGSGGVTRGVPPPSRQQGSAGSAEPAMWSQVKAAAEAVTLRLVRHYLSNGVAASATAAVAQFRRHMMAFGAPPSPPAIAVGARVAWHYAWLSRQYLVMGEVLTEHLSRFPPGAPGSAAAAALAAAAAAGGPAVAGLREAAYYVNSEYYYHNAAVNAVLRRLAAEAEVAAVEAAGIEAAEAAAWAEDLATRDPVFLGEERRLDDASYPRGSQAAAVAQERLRALLVLEEASVTHADLSTLLVAKALEHCPATGAVRRRAFLVSLLAEERLAAGAPAEALVQWGSAADLYLREGWLELAAAVLGQMLRCAWELGRVPAAVDVSLKLAGRRLRPWVAAEDRRCLLADAAAMVATVAAANAAASAAGAAEGGRGSADVAPVRLPLSRGTFMTVPSVCPPVLEAELDSSRLLLQVAGRFPAAEVPVGTPVMLRLGVLSHFALPLHFDTLELLFNHDGIGSVLADTAPAAVKRHAMTAALAAAGDDGDGDDSGSDDGGGAISAQHAGARELRAVLENDGGAESKRQLATNLLVPPGQLLVFEVPVRVRDGLVSAGSFFLKAVRLRLAKGLPEADFGGGSGGGGVGVEGIGAMVFTVPVCSDLELQLEVGRRAWRASGSLTVRLMPPTPRATIAASAAAVSSGDPVAAASASPLLVLQGALTPLYFRVAANGDSVVGGKLRLAVRPAPADASAQRAFFCEQAGSSSDGSTGGVDSRRFRPMTVGPDGQPHPPLAVPELQPGQSAVMEVWVRPALPGPVAVVAQLDYRQAAGSGWTVTASAEADLLCAPPFSLASEVLSLQDGCCQDSDVTVASLPPSPAGGGGAEGFPVGTAAPVVASFVGAVGDPLAVRLSLVLPQAQTISVRRIEVISPPPLPPREGGPAGPAAETACVLLDDAVLYDANNGTGPMALDAGDIFTACFCATVAAPGTARLGVLRVHWRRGAHDESDCGRSSGGDGGGAPPTPPPPPSPPPLPGAAPPDTLGLEAVTELPLPKVTVTQPPLRARLEVPAMARVGREFRLLWEVSNASHRHHELQVVASGGSEFVWSGRRQCDLQLPPHETVQLRYCLVPLVPGHVLLPQFCIVSSRLEASVVRDIGDAGLCIFVRP
ncbi:unnamed protein product [Phaeothamnion confervicola]